MFNREEFENEKAIDIQNAFSDDDLRRKGLEFVVKSDKHRYGYFWTWMGLPIIQMPEDIVLTQEILWETKPDVVIEAGIAWGGSLAMYAGFQELQGFGHTYGIDVTIPEHNRNAILGIPVANRITLVEGSSTDPQVFSRLANEISTDANVMLVLDSNHTHEHVLAELRLWSPLLKKGNYVIVSDTIVENIPIQTHRPRPWGPGNNPMTGMQAFLKNNSRFSFDNEYSKRAINSFNPNGYLLCME
jgi:cephalosporin hydroxylase